MEPTIQMVVLLGGTSNRNVNALLNTALHTGGSWQALFQQGVGNNVILCSHGYG